VPASTAEEEKAVVAVVVRCAAAFDRREWEALEEVFTPDASAYGVNGRDEVVRFVRGFLGGCGPSQHLLGNHHILVDGDTAKSVCKARVFHVGAGERSHLTYECFGNYWDDLVLTHSGWRIASRVFEVTISLGDTSVLQPG
jgi:SnoaL-like domain